MKFLTVPHLASLSTRLSHVDTGDQIVHVRLEAYSCKATVSDKRLERELDRAITLELAHSPPEASFQSPLGSIAESSTRKLLASLISTMNASFPDYDFSDLRPEQFDNEPSVQHVMKHVDTVFLASLDQLLPGIRAELWQAVQETVVTDQCEVFSWSPDVDSDINDGKLWLLHYFFYNKKEKKIVFLAASAVSKLHASAEALDHDLRAADEDDVMDAQLMDDAAALVRDDLADEELMSDNPTFWNDFELDEAVSSSSECYHLQSPMSTARQDSTGSTSGISVGGGGAGIGGGASGSCTSTLGKVFELAGESHASARSMLIPSVAIAIPARKGTSHAVGKVRNHSSASAASSASSASAASSSSSAAARAPRNKSSPRGANQTAAVLRATDLSYTPANPMFRVSPTFSPSQKRNKRGDDVTELDLGESAAKRRVSGGGGGGGGGGAGAPSTASSTVAVVDPNVVASAVPANVLRGALISSSLSVSSSTSA